MRINTIGANTQTFGAARTPKPKQTIDTAIGMAIGIGNSKNPVDRAMLHQLAAIIENAEKKQDVNIRNSEARMHRDPAIKRNVKAIMASLM